MSDLLPVSSAAIPSVEGQALVMGENDINTDRIIPARFLKELTFDKLGNQVFYDDRAQATAAGSVHPFDDPRRGEARLLFVAKNFGCGSSREHAPQAIRRWGIRAIVGESYGEIFQGNSSAIGLPCLVASEGDAAAMRSMAETHPAMEFTLDLEKCEVRCAEGSWPVQIDEPLRRRFVSGSWDTLSELAAALDHDIPTVAVSLPYINGWSAGG